MQRVLSVAIILALSANVALAEQAPGWKIAIDYIGDALGTVRGGIKRSSSYNGLASLSAAFDTERWSAFGGVLAPHGQSASERHVGDFGVVSNIDTGGLDPRVGELWLQRNARWGSLRAGMLMLDTEFWLSDSAALFSNGSFGAPSTISANLTNSPVYPLGAAGIRAQWNHGEQGTWRAAVVDGDGGDPTGENRHGLDVDLGQGALMSAEYQWHFSPPADASNYLKLGLFHHTGRFTEWAGGRQRRGNTGAYLVIDRPLNEQANWFVRASGTRSAVAVAPWALEAGIVWREALNTRGSFGLGLAHIDLNSYILADSGEPLRHEMIVDVTYEIELSDYFTLQPELQYISNAGGPHANPDTVVIGLRAKLSF